MSAINTNESGFVNFSCRDWSFAGDKGTWIKYDDSTRTITVNVAAKGTISSKYLAELEAFAAEHGFAADFAAIRCGERRSITLPAPQMTEETVEEAFVFDGQTYTLLEQAEPTSAHFDNCFQDVRDGETYTAAWSARAVSVKGEKVNIIWHFTQTKGQEDSPEDLPWDSEHIESVTCM